MTDVKCVWQANAILGESPIWVARENAVYWVDIFSKQVHRYARADGATQSWTFETEVTSLAPRKQGGLVGTVRDGFAHIDLNTSTVQPIVLPEADVPGNRFNDGKVDAQGRYWAGTMDEGQSAQSGVLYRLDADLSLHRMDDGYIITNGPTFSADGAILYHTDTITRTVYAFDLDADGAIHNKRVFIQLEDEAEGMPDGMTVDSENCLWLCHFGGARITRYSPQGQVLQVISMPMPNITSCTFAGPELDTLYITTARHPLSEAEAARDYPLAGGLFTYRPGVAGLPTSLFAG